MFEDIAKPHTREHIIATVRDKLTPKNGKSETFIVHTTWQLIFFDMNVWMPPYQNKSYLPTSCTTLTSNSHRPYMTTTEVTWLAQGEGS